MNSELITVIDDVRSLLLETGNASLRRSGAKVNLVVSERVLNWAIAAVANSGYPRAALESHLQTLPKHQRWIFLQQRLPEKALTILAQRLHEQKLRAAVFNQKAS